MAEPVRQRRLRLKLSTIEESIEIGAFLPQLNTTIDTIQRVSSDANTARVRILHLSPQSRGWLQRTARRSLDVTNQIASKTGAAANSSRVAKIETQKRSDVFTEIDAGYDDLTGRLFEGSCQYARSTKTDEGWSTDLVIGDGMALQLGAIVAREFKPKTQVFTVVKHLVESMGLGLGNLTKLILDQAMSHPSNTFPAGYSAIGSAKWSLDHILRLTGAEWFIDEGTFYVTRATAPLSEPEFLLTPDTGLLGRPAGMEGGGYIVRTFMRNDIRLARQVRLESEEVRGVFRADVIRHRGNNRSGPFETVLTLQTIQPIGSAG